MSEGGFDLRQGGRGLPGEMRMNLLRRGMMKTAAGKMIWNLWKPTQSKDLVEWFEGQIFSDEELAGFNLDESELVKNTIR